VCRGGGSDPSAGVSAVMATAVRAEEAGRGRGRRGAPARATVTRAEGPATSAQVGPGVPGDSGAEDASNRRSGVFAKRHERQAGRTGSTVRSTSARESDD